MKSLVLAILLSAGLNAAALAQDKAPAKPDAKPETKQPEVKPAETKPPQVKPDPNLPSGESLFEKHVKAIGGLDAIKAEKNRMVRAKYVGPGDTGEGMMRVLRVPPDKLYQTLEIPGVITQEVWCDSEAGWMRDSNNGTHKLQGDAFIEYKRLADYCGEANYKARYKELQTLAAEKFNDVDAYSVRAVPTEGKERTIYFDAKSGLMIGVLTPGQPGTESDSTTTFGEYKKFGDVLQPTSFVTKSRKAQSTITITEILTNLTTMPSVTAPDEVRAVK